MTLQAYRLVQTRFTATAFDGEGARQFGGRWNHKGTGMIYLAQSLSLAALELLVHLDSRQVMEERYRCILVEFPKEICAKVTDLFKLPKNWATDPAPNTTKRIGDLWVKERKSTVMAVPSALIPREWNYLVNPAHPDFPRIIVGKPQRFHFDPRLAR
jgi:RES domain-containing protein